jgi:glycosyltransferase involved in cell wall biosynthesis
MIIILFIGSAISKNAAKGFSNLIHLIEYLSTKKISDKITFLVLGDNFETREFGDKLCIKSGGWVHDRNEVVKYYQAADLYIHLANAENFPTTILEAMHCGLPVIGSKVGGIPEQIDHEQTGFCFHNREINHIGDSLLDLVRDKERRSLLANNGNHKALKIYTHTKMVHKYINWFQEVLDRKNQTGYK